MKVGIIGLGNMGYSMALRLVEKGFNVYAWNRSREKLERITREGVKPVETPRDLALTTDTVIVMVSDDEALREIVYGFNGLLKGVKPGFTLINTSTTTPFIDKEISTKIELEDACFIEAPVLGGPRVARRGELLIIASGRKHCIEKNKPVLEALGKIMHVSERIGEAMVLKLAFNTLLISSLELLSETIGLVESWGINPEYFAEILSETVFAAFAKKYYSRLLAEEYPTSFKLSLAAKDLEYGLKTGNYKGQPLPLIATATQMYKLASLYGYGGEDYSRISLFIRRLRKWPQPKEYTL